MEAQRFPQDFDGISAGAPATFSQFQNSFFHGWNVAANQRGRYRYPAEKIAFL